MKTYLFIEDAGHGWLRVPRNEVLASGVAGDISGHSFQDLEYAYLEEDCDMARFCNAIGITTQEAFTQWMKERVTVKRVFGEAHCRYLPRFCPYVDVAVATVYSAKRP